MTTETPTHSTLIEALIAAQSEFPGIPKEASGQARGGRYQYATLPAVLEAVVPSLNRHGIALIQRTAVEGESLTLHTILRHTSGEEVESVVPLPMPASWQDWGSAMTYARRYSITALAGVAPDDDDDGARAQGAPQAAPRPVGAYGVCDVHDVAYFKSGKMPRPAHKLDDGGWCNKPDDEPPPPAPSLAAQAAEVAAARTPMPLNTAMAPHGVCPEHKAVLVPIGNTGKKGHWRTVNGNRIVCELAPMLGLDQQANDKQGDLGWGGMPPATAENTRPV